MNQQPPQQNSGGPTSELRSDAEKLGSSAANRIHSEVDARKETAAGQAKSLSSAIEQTAGRLDQNAPDWLKTALRQGAEKIQAFADTIENKDSRTLMRDTQKFARNNPGTFLAAFAAAGFAAARILKAGAVPEQGHQGQTTGPSDDYQPSSNRAQPQPAVGATTSGEFV